MMCNLHHEQNSILNKTIFQHRLKAFPCEQGIATYSMNIFIGNICDVAHSFLVNIYNHDITKTQ